MIHMGNHRRRKFTWLWLNDIIRFACCIPCEQRFHFYRVQQYTGDIYVSVGHDSFDAKTKLINYIADSFPQ